MLFTVSLIVYLEKKGHRLKKNLSSLYKSKVCLNFSHNKDSGHLVYM